MMPDQSIEELLMDEDWNECLWDDVADTLYENLKEDEDAC